MAERGRVVEFADVEPRDTLVTSKGNAMVYPTHPPVFGETLAPKATLKRAPTLPSPTLPSPTRTSLRIMIIRLSVACVLLTSVCCPGTLSAQEPSKAGLAPRSVQIGEYLAAYHDRDSFSGSALVADGGEVVYRGAFGLANADWQLSNGVDTKFRLASVSKQFTAMLVLLLVEDGKLELAAPIVRYLPDYPARSGRRVTVHHLLNHTSGIPNYTNRPGFMQRDALLHHSTDEFVAKFCSEPLEFEPGAYFHYSNSGYYLLAAIIEDVTGMSHGASAVTSKAASWERLKSGQS